jgi:hypothetical protein
LVEEIEKNIDPDIERVHIEQAKKRRDEIKTGKIKPIQGDDALNKIKSMVKL